MKTVILCGGLGTVVDFLDEDCVPEKEPLGAIHGVFPQRSLHNALNDQK